MKVDLVLKGVFIVEAALSDNTLNNLGIHKPIGSFYSIFQVRNTISIEMLSYGLEICNKSLSN